MESRVHHQAEPEETIFRTGEGCSDGLGMSKQDKKAQEKLDRIQYSDQTPARREVWPRLEEVCGEVKVRNPLG